jgi:hypothetical protein
LNDFVSAILLIGGAATVLFVAPSSWPVLTIEHHEDADLGGDAPT